MGIINTVSENQDSSLGYDLSDLDLATESVSEQSESWNEYVHSSWKSLCENPKFNDLPYKIETDKYGKIIMSPMRLVHGKYQVRIARIVAEKMIGGETISECAIRTTEGTRVADVAWFSADRWDIVKDEYDATVAPEICVEIMSPSNTIQEMDEKRALYFEKGALEFWLCSEEGEMSFFNANGKMEQSEMCAEFPVKIEG